MGILDLSIFKELHINIGGINISLATKAQRYNVGIGLFVIGIAMVLIPGSFPYLPQIVKDITGYFAAVGLVIGALLMGSSKK